MGVSDFRDLVCWQLSRTLKREALAFTATGQAAKDFKYCDQIRASSASAPANISEGFGRFTPKEFARFLGYARASLLETQNHLIDGLDRGYLDEALYNRLFNLATAALTATTNLMLSKLRQASSAAPRTELQSMRRSPPKRRPSSSRSTLSEALAPSAKPSTLSEAAAPTAKP
jgi:four helix bundle protein